MQIRLVTALAALSVIHVSGYTDPGPCSGDCYVRDPALIRRSSDGIYFKFSTGTGIYIYKASNISGPWAYEGLVLPSGSVIDPSNANTWKGDEYVLYYALSQLGSQESSIGFAISPTMENGTWVDAGWAGLSSYPETSAYNAIDPALISTEDGSTLLNFGSYWGDIYQLPVEGLTVVGSSTAKQIAYNASGNHNIEAPFMYYHDGYYYLFFSQGVAGSYDVSLPAPGDEYKIFVCRSQSYSGEFIDQNGVSCLDSGGTLVLPSHDHVYGPGGQGVVSDPTYGDVLYYHYVNTNIGLSNAYDTFGWNVIKWLDGWPTI